MKIEKRKGRKKRKKTKIEFLINEIIRYILENFFFYKKENII